MTNPLNKANKIYFIVIKLYKTFYILIKMKKWIRSFSSFVGSTWMSFSSKNLEIWKAFRGISLLFLVVHFSSDAETCWSHFSTLEVTATSYHHFDLQFACSASGISLISHIFFLPDVPVVWYSYIFCFLVFLSTTTISCQIAPLLATTVTTTVFCLDWLV